MSGLAEILKDAGFRVSGSDRSKPLTETLERRGSMYFMDNVPGILPMISIVSYLPARFTKTIPNMSLLWKRDPASHQSAAFRRDHAELQDPIAISGTHGKTTTTSMVSEILLHAGTDPTLSIGGMLKASVATSVSAVPICSLQKPANTPTAS